MGSIGGGGRMGPGALTLSSQALLLFSEFGQTLKLSILLLLHGMGVKSQGLLKPPAWSFQWLRNIAAHTCSPGPWLCLSP